MSSEENSLRSHHIHVLLLHYIPKNGSDKSSVASANHDAWDEETTGDASSIRPTGNKEVYQEHNQESGQRKCT